MQITLAVIRRACLKNWMLLRLANSGPPFPSTSSRFAALLPFPFFYLFSFLQGTRFLLIKALPLLHLHIHPLSLITHFAPTFLLPRLPSLLWCPLMYSHTRDPTVPTYSFLPRPSLAPQFLIAHLSYSLLPCFSPHQFLCPTTEGVFESAVQTSRLTTTSSHPMWQMVSAHNQYIVMKEVMRKEPWQLHVTIQSMH